MAIRIRVIRNRLIGRAIGKRVIMRMLVGHKWARHKWVGHKWAMQRLVGCRRLVGHRRVERINKMGWSRFMEPLWRPPRVVIARIGLVVIARIRLVAVQLTLLGVQLRFERPIFRLGSIQLFLGICRLGRTLFNYKYCIITSVFLLKDLGDVLSLVLNSIIIGHLPFSWNIGDHLLLLIFHIGLLVGNVLNSGFPSDWLREIIYQIWIFIPKQQ